MKTKAQIPQGQLGGARELSEIDEEASGPSSILYRGPPEMPECLCQTLKSSALVT